jgi:hypothetical protein
VAWADPDLDATLIEHADVVPGSSCTVIPVGSGFSRTVLSVAARLGDMVQPLAALVGALVVTGGDTATSVLRAWGTTAFDIAGTGTADERSNARGASPGGFACLAAAPRD